MSASFLLLSGLATLVALALLAKRLEWPYPIVFLLGGAALVFVPDAPQIVLRPEYVFLILLPPLLFSGGWGTDWNEFRASLRAISLLAIGLVFTTTAVVAVLVHALLPQLGWAAAVVLGAIVSPPDAVAATEVFERFSVPRRISTILEGEGLVNDATALVIYRFAVAAAVSGTFSAASAGFAFFWTSIGGVAVGLAIAYGFSKILGLLQRSDMSDALLNNVIFLIAPYAIYIGADSLGLSGVLATVAGGIFISRLFAHRFDPESRLIATSVWQLLLFLFNGAVFLLIGLQLRAILHSPDFVARTWWIGLLVSLAAIVARIAWVFPATYLPRIFSRRIREREIRPGPNYVFIVAWSGMRGIVSLAAAVALPLRDAAGHPFPGRDVIIFVTFCVIFVTLVGQGLTLIPLIGWLGIEGGSGEAETLAARIAALEAGIRRLRELEPEFSSTDEWEVEGRILAEYEYRIAHLRGHPNGDGPKASEVDADHRLQTEAVAAERAELLRMRNAGEVPDEIFRELQYDLDLAESRLR